MQSIIRVGIYYDGNYFTHVSNYYNYVHDRKSRLSIGGLHDYLKGRIALQMETESELCKITESHYYKNRLSAQEASERENQIYFDRVFDDILAFEHVQAHYIPSKGILNTRSGDKSLNIRLALDAFEASSKDNFDVFVLVAVDGDYTPLVKKIQATGKVVVLVSWDFEFTNDDGKRMTTRTSQDLSNSAHYSFTMHELIEEGLDEGDDAVQNLFVLPPVEERKSREEGTQRSYQSTSVENSDAKPGETHTGNILTLKTGYGFIEFEPNNLFFHHSSLTNADFNDLFEGDHMEFMIEENEKGELVAKEVKLME